MKVELTKFKVKKGKSERVDEWIEYMQNNMEDVLLNLKAEKMYVETIFREKFNDVEYLYWYSVQDSSFEGPERDTYIDETHLEFMEKCIDFTFRPDDMRAEIIMIPDKVLSAMK